MPSALDLLLNQLRRDLEREEGPLRSQLILAYESAIYDLEHDLFNVTWLIEDARERGVDITPDWLYRQDRYQRLITKAEAQMARFAGEAMPIVETTFRQGAGLGVQHAPSLLEAAGIRASFGSSINVPAVDTIMQLAYRPGPVRDVLESYGPNAAAVIRHELTQSVILGKSPRQTVRDIQRTLASGTNRARLNTLTRTEHLRAYRLAQQETMRPYSHAITGWAWSASLSSRTCLACMALHNQVFDEPQSTQHPNCRCVMRPLGRYTPERYRDTRTGEGWIRAQPEHIQRAMFPSEQAYQEFKANRLGLQDFVGHKHSDVWGTSVFERSGKDAITVAKRRRR